MKVKICGMRSQENIDAISRFDPDFLGFVFYPGSRRFAGNDEKHRPVVRDGIGTVGVFVSEPVEAVAHRVEAWKLTGVQLHGDESVEFVRELRTQLPGGTLLLKAFGVGGSGSFPEVTPYEDVCDFFLFDTAAGERGGTGRTFPWTRLEEYQGDTPILLAGGLGPGTLEELGTFLESRPALRRRVAGVDLNSRVEIEPGLKDPELVAKAIRQVRKL